MRMRRLTVPLLAKHRRHFAVVDEDAPLGMIGVHVYKEQGGGEAPQTSEECGNCRWELIIRQFMA